MRVLGYLRVSTAEQASSGLGLEAQRSAIAQQAEIRGWDVDWVEDGGYSAKNLRRPGIGRALAELKAGHADTLVVAKLDRLSRSIIDFGSVLERARTERWSVVALDLGVDTTTPAGELVANVMMAVAQWERRAIGQRTKDALAAKKAQGVKLGRPVALDPSVEALVLELAGEGMSAAAIARRLNVDGVLSATGAKWWPTSVSRVLSRGA